MTESELTRKFCKLLTDNHGVLVLPIAGGRYQKPGVADRFMASHYWRTGIFVEFKKAPYKLSAPQKRMAEELRMRNVHTIIVTWTADESKLLFRGEYIDAFDTLRFFNLVKDLLDDR
jgi:hypothetical protein